MTEMNFAQAFEAGMPAVPLELDVNDKFLSDRTLELISDIDPQFDHCRLRLTERDQIIHLINSPDMIREVLVSNHRKFKKGPEFSRIKILTGGGLIVSDGPKWSTSRRLVQPSFIKANWDILQNASDEEADKLCDRFVQLAKDGTHVDITAEAETFAMNTIIRSIFSKDFDLFYEEDGSCLFDALKNGNVKNLDVVSRVRTARKQVLAVIQARHDSTETYRDMLNLLLETRKKSAPDFTDAEIVDELVTLIVAGYETSAILLGWICFSLASNSTCRDYLDCPTEQQPERFASLANECLRMYPPVWMFSRRALEDIQIGPLMLNKGDVVAISPFMLHRRADAWAQPDTFDPARFEGLDHNDPRWPSFLPFSAGPRRCIGDVMSNYEVQSVMSRIHPKIDFELISAPEISFEPLINLRSRNPIVAKLSLKRSPDV